MADDYRERRWTSPDGLSLFAREYGAEAATRLPVICLHGLTRNCRDFKDVAACLAAQGRRVLALDMRGRGQSDWDPTPENYQPATYAADVAGWLDALGIVRAAFIGTSMGGIILTLLANRRPDLVGAAVLNDIGPEIAPEGLARIQSYVGIGHQVATWEEAAAYAEAINGAAFPDYEPAEWQRFARRLFREEDGQLRLDYDPAIASQVGSAPAPAQQSAWPAFRQLACGRPMLLLRGALSDLLSSETALRMQREAPSMDYVEVPNTGHAPMLTEPSAADALDAFLARLP